MSSANLRTLTVSIVANAQPMIKGLQAIRSNLGGFALKLGALSAGAFSIAEAFQGAADQDKALSRLNAVLLATGHSAGLTSQQLQNMASDLQRTTTFADDVTLSASAVMAGFKNIKGDNFRLAMMAAQDMATVMGGDLQGAVMQVSKALNDPVKGLTALSRAGVTFSDQQKQMIATLVKTNNVAGAQKIILQELASEFGGAAAAEAQTFAGQVTQLKLAVGDFAESLAARAQPALANTVSGLKALTANMSDPAVFKSILNWGKYVAGLTAAVYIAPKVVSSIGFISKAMQELGKATAKANGIGQAFSGPKGWATLLVGSAVAIGTSWGIDKLFQQTAEEADAVSASLKKNAAQLQQLDQVQLQTNESGDKFIEGLKQQVATFGMTSRAAELYKAQQEGLTAAAIKQARALDLQLTSLEASKRMMDETAQAREEMEQKAQAIRESLLTDQERQIAHAKEMIELVHAGKLTWEEYAKAQHKASVERIKSASSFTPNIPQAIERGSAGAMTAIAESRGAQRMHRLAEKQLQAELEQVNLQRQLVQQGANGSGGGNQTVIVQF